MTMIMSTTTAVYKKRLEGIQTTEELRQLLKETLSVLENETMDASTATTDTTQSSIQPLSIAEARSILLEYNNNNNNNNNNNSDDYIPILVIRAMQTVLPPTKVEQALQQNTKLVFTAPPPETKPTMEQERFRQRMKRLRLKQEENKYSKLTSNLGHRNDDDDDVTTKSMTYAASIGLNMIIAPLSFGCFMYFFAGGLLNYLEEAASETTRRTPDIRKVIAGVVSGVFMLFVEMLLFVIRTHEVDKAMRKKKRKKKNSPFGYYSSETSKTYKED